MGRDLFEEAGIAPDGGRDLFAEAGIEVEEESGRTVGNVLKDVGVTGLKGLMGLQQSIIGLADLTTGGNVGRALDSVGISGDESQKGLSGLYSAPQQEANRKLEEAKGFTGKLTTALENPSTILTTVGESIPQMIGGAGVARGLLSASKTLAPWAAGAVGEGVMGMGSAAEGIREESADRGLTGKQSLDALGSGAGTALFGALGGKITSKLGWGDIDTILARGGPEAIAAGAAKQGFLKQVIGSGISEGVFEELPQSMQETMWQNHALGKPIMEGVPESAAMGLLAGGFMGGAGGGYNAIAGKTTPAAPVQAPNLDPIIQDVAGIANMPSVVDSIDGADLLDEINASQSETPRAIVETPGPHGIVETAQGAPNGTASTDPAEMVAQGGESGSDLAAESLPAAVAQRSSGGLDAVAGGIAPGSGTDLAAGTAGVGGGAVAVPNTAQTADVASGQQSAQSETQAALPATGDTQHPIARVGTTPNSSEPVTVRGGVIHLGDYPAQNFETGDDITVPEGASFAQVKQALQDAGALSSRQKVFPGVFGSKKAAEVAAPAPISPQPVEPKPRPSRLTPLDDARLSDEDYKSNLPRYAQVAGWEEEGGKLIRNHEGDAVGRTAWVPRSDWWLTKPSSVTEKILKAAVPKSINGEPMTMGEKHSVRWLLDVIEKDLTARETELEADMPAADETLAAMFAEDDAELPGFSTGETDTAAQMRALGFTEEEINAELKAGEGAEAAGGIAAGTAREGDRVGEGQAGTEAGTGQKSGFAGQDQVVNRRNDSTRPTSEEHAALLSEVEALRTEKRTSTIAGIPNLVAFEQDAALGWEFVGAADMDGMSFYNDLLGHHPTDILIRTVGDVLGRHAGDSVRFYHRSGDEFMARASDREALEQAMASAQAELEGAITLIETVLDDGSSAKVRITGLGLSYGTNHTYAEADKNASQAKQDRTVTGKRAPKGTNPGGIEVLDEANGGTRSLGERGESRESAQERLTGFSLAGQTAAQAEAADKAAKQAAADKADAEAKAEARAKADRARDDFSLTGSIRASDANAGQDDIFSAPEQSKQSAITAINQSDLSTGEKLSTIAAVNKGDIAPEDVREVVGEGGKPEGGKQVATQEAKPEAEQDYKDRIHTLAVHKDLFDRIYKGETSADEYKAAFDSLQSNKDGITAELSTLTKDTLLKRFPGVVYRYKNEKKAAIVEAAYRDMVDDFTLGEGYSYGMSSGSRTDSIRAIVDRSTDQTLADHAEAIKQATEERKARKEEVSAGMADPQTLDDFHRLMAERAQGMGGNVTYQQVRMTLTPEQRERFDVLAAEKSRGARASSKDAEQARSIRAPGEAVDTTDIIKSKHTKHGHDLWQFNLVERVSGEEFKSLVGQAKRLGGDYSSYRGNGAIPGWQFRTEEAAIAFKALVAGDTTQARNVMQTRRDAYADDRSQTAVERLTEMADSLEEKADASLGQERKANTDKRARQAASAEASANSDKAMARTMRNIAGAIENGTAKLLDRVRQRVQVETLYGFVNTAQNEKLRALYPSYAEQQKHEGEKPNAETADYVTFPSYTAFRSDLASLGRALLETEGTKKLGQRLMKVADDVSDAYLKFAKENIDKVSTFRTKEGLRAAFPSKAMAEASIQRSGYKGAAIALPVKRNENQIILSPSEAIKRGVWEGDNDKRITLIGEFGEELVEKLGKLHRRDRNSIAAPWQFDSAYDKRKRLAGMGIETPAELRAAVREFIALREAPKEADKIKEMERAMIGRRNDGMDFFPTPASVADEMVETAGIQPGMSVLEPSAGMGHIAERIRAAGVDPDVIELSNERKELLKAKGFRVIGRDFMDIKPREFFTFGDTFRAKDGTEGVMRGLGGMGSNRVRLVVNGDERTARYVDRDDLTPVSKNGTDSGYDRILMNPPFGDRRDAVHVQHAYELLKPGGRIVSIMGEGVFFGSDKKAQAFRDWLEQVGATDEKLDEGTFLDPSLPVNTGTNARMVVIDKPGAEIVAVAEPDDTGTAMFKRGNESTGQPVASVQQTVDAMTADWKNAPPIVIATDMSDPAIPQKVRDEDEKQKSQGANGEPDGFIYQGTVYLIAGQLKTEGDIARVLAHESLGHAGLRGLYGEVLAPILKQIVTLRSKEVAAKARQYGLDVTKEADRLTAAEEVLAEMAQTKPEMGFVKRAIAAIRQWLRARGLKLDLTDADLIASYLLPARAFIERGGKPAASSNAAPAFAKGDSLAAKVWRILSGDPIIFQHAMPDSFEMGEAAQEINRKMFAREDALDLEEEKHLAKKWHVTMPDGTHAYVMESKKGEVWIDASRLQEGSSGGTRLYLLVGSYAEGNGKVFIGDPAGLSDVALIRRTENMLSLALRFGRTDFMLPHEYQMNPEAKLNTVLADVVRPLDWVEGDNAGNLEELLKTSYANTLKLAPEIKNVTYNFDKQRFERDGAEFTDFAGIVKRGTGELRKRGLSKILGAVGSGVAGTAEARPPIGSATLKRAAILNTVAHAARSGRGGELLAEISRVVPGGLSPLAGILYSRTAIRFSRQSTTHGTTTPQANTIPEETRVQAGQRVVQDQFNRFRVLQDWLKEQGVSLSEKADVYLAETLMSGRISTRKQDFRENQMAQLIEKTQAAGISMEQVGDYLKAQHAPEANKRARELHGKPDATAYGMSDQDAKDAMDAFKALPGFAQLKALAGEWRDITAQSKKILLDAGILSTEQVAAWGALYSDYVPVKGLDDKPGNGTGKGLGVNGRQKQRMGHGLRDEGIIENILRDHERAISLDEKNRVGHALIRFALEAKNPDIITVGKPVKRQVLQKGQSSYIVTHQGADVAAFDTQADASIYITQEALKGKTKSDFAVAKTTDPVRVMLQASPMLADNEVNVYVAGHAVRVQINDEIAARAYTRMGVEHLNAILSAGREMNTWLSKVYTGYSPDFIFTNPLRDATQGFVTLTGEYGMGMAAKIFGNYPLAMKELINHFRKAGSSAIVDDYRANGGSTGAAYLSDLERIGNDVQAAYNEYAGMLDTYQRTYDQAIDSGKSVAKAHTMATLKSGIAGAKRIPLIGHVLRLLERINSVTENALRVATYHTLVQDGVSKPRAAAQAKNLMNFNRKGEISNQAGALYLFFNPAVQGTQVIQKALFDSKHKNQARALAGMMVLSAIALAELAMMGGDDEEDKWNNTPDHVKDGNMVFQFGDYQLTLTLPYGYRVFHVLGNVISDFAHGTKDGYQLGIRMASNVFGNFSPVGNPMEGEHFPFQVLPTAAKMLLGPSVNEDGFGRAIGPMRYSDAKPDSQMLNRATKGSVYSEVAEGLNKLTGGSKYERGMIDVSPETLKYWVRGLTGGAGQFAIDTISAASMATQGAIPQSPKDIPIARRFVREIGVADTRSAFWDRANEAKQAAEEFSAAKRNRDGEAMADIFDEKGPLIALSKYATRQQKMVKALRDEFDRIKNDDNLPLKQKQAQMKLIEIREASVYNRFIEAFDEDTGRKKAVNE